MPEMSDPWITFIEIFPVDASELMAEIELLNSFPSILVSELWKEIPTPVSLKDEWRINADTWKSSIPQSGPSTEIFSMFSVPPESSMYDPMIPFSIPVKSVSEIDTVPVVYRSSTPKVGSGPLQSPVVQDPAGY